MSVYPKLDRTLADGCRNLDDSRGLFTDLTRSRGGCLRDHVQEAEFQAKKQGQIKETGNSIAKFLSDHDRNMSMKWL